MSLKEEYGFQEQWRKWPLCLDHLPEGQAELILDLGCGTGMMTASLAGRAARVIGIDRDASLLREASERHDAPGVSYLQADLREMQALNIPPADGIWSSYVASYFPDFDTIFDSWLSLLKPGGWIALVEMSDLLGHRPLAAHWRKKITAYYRRQREAGMYDFMMGSRLRDSMGRVGLEILRDTLIDDEELTFKGAATLAILDSWSKRLDRMTGFRDYIGEVAYHRFRTDFLSALSAPDHVTDTRVFFLVGKKPG